jgi:hypothetical protein
VLEKLSAEVSRELDKLRPALVESILAKETAKKEANTQKPYPQEISTEPWGREGQQVDAEACTVMSSKLSLAFLT